MSPDPSLATEPMNLIDILARGVAGMSDSLMPVSWLEALIDRLEGRR